LVHGWASHSFRWKKYIEELIKNDYTVYALDAPAHGNSTGKLLHVLIYKEILEEFLKQNTKVTQIIAHSIGGFATTYLLSEIKNHTIKKTVIMATPAEAQDFFKFYKKTLGLTDKAVHIIIGEFVKRLHHPPAYYSSKRMAQLINIPALIVHDKDDLATDYNNSVCLHEKWKNSELLLTEGLGHDLKSKELLQKVIGFLS
jgi:pimeloyl-ACP methyl ester carboxylesterase